MIKKEPSISINYKIKKTIFEDALEMYIADREKDEELLQRYHNGEIQFTNNNN